MAAARTTGVGSGRGATTGGAITSVAVFVRLTVGTRATLPTKGTAGFRVATEAVGRRDGAGIAAAFHARAAKQTAGEAQGAVTTRAGMDCRGS